MTRSQLWSEVKMDNSRKLQIAEAAQKLFLHYGIKKTTISDIAREAGIGKGTVYLDFKSKEEILFYLAGRQFQKMAVVIQNEIQSIANPLERISYLMKHYILGTYDFVQAWPHAEEIYHIMVSGAGAEQDSDSDQVLFDAVKHFADDAFEQKLIPLQKDESQIRFILFMAHALLPPYCRSLESREALEHLTDRYCEMAELYLKN